MAHQGGAGLWPSNTLFAFERAVALGVDVLEMDIHATRDGVLVVRHDPVVDTTTDGSGAIQDLTLAQIKTLDAGYTWTSDEGQTYPYRGQKITIPTLDEVFQAFPAMRLNIDIKPDSIRVTEAFCQLLTRSNRQLNVTVGSFYDRQISCFRRLCHATPTAAGVTETRLFYMLEKMGLSRFYRPPAQAFQIPETFGSRRIVTPGFIANAHRQGLQVHIWTVDDPADMRRLIAWGVDGLFTDYPDRLLACTKTRDH